VEGQGDNDTLLFNGAVGAEIFAASANGGRLLFTRNVGNIVMDVDDVEILTLNLLGGTDAVTVNDLLATDVTNANLNLGVNGVGDGAVDAVTVNGTTGDDIYGLSGSAGSVSISHPGTDISLTNAEPANDNLTLNTSSGDDVASATSLASSSVVMTLNGGNDDDVLRGSAGADTLNCGPGTDYAEGGPGVDVINGDCETTAP
jgi:hypothetical protein